MHQHGEESMRLLKWSRLTIGLPMGEGLKERVGLGEGLREREGLTGWWNSRNLFLSSSTRVSWDSRPVSNCSSTSCWFFERTTSSISTSLP